MGVWSRPPCGSVDPEIAARFAGVVDDLRGLGAEVAPVDLPEGDHLATFTVLWSCGAATRAAALSTDARGKLDPGLREIVAAGDAFSAVRYVEAMAARADFGRRMDALLDRFDILVSPATSIPAFGAGHEVPPGSGMTRWFEWAGFSFPINLSQQPAASVPCGMTESNLPIGLQIVGPRGQDSRRARLRQGLRDRLSVLLPVKAGPTAKARTRTRDTRTLPIHDTIILGAGSSGCVLANRLSADPARNVLGAGSGRRHARGVRRAVGLGSRCSTPRPIGASTPSRRRAAAAAASSGREAGWWVGRAR